jgi:hypothetical protein
MRRVGADHFRPLAQRAPVTYGRRPGLGKDAVILNSKFELQTLAPVVGVACKARIGTLDAPNLSLASFFGFFRSFVIEQPITLYDVQSRAVRRAVHVCWPGGVPFVLWNIGMQMLQQPDKITILYSNDHEVRHVRMNQSHPARVTPSWYGDSVGHYEGDTLVIDSVGVKIGPLTGCWGLDRVFHLSRFRHAS